MLRDPFGVTNLGAYGPSEGHCGGELSLVIHHSPSRNRIGRLSHFVCYADRCALAQFTFHLTTLFILSLTALALLVGTIIGYVLGRGDCRCG